MAVRGLRVATIGLLLQTVASPLCAGIMFQPIALTDEPAPGTKHTFYDFGIAYLDSLGHVAFNAAAHRWLGQWWDSTDGLWSTTSGTLSLVAGQGNPAPGGGTFNTLMGNSYFVLSQSGNLALGAALQNAGGDFLCVQRPSGFQVIARSNTPAPGTGQVKFANTDFWRFTFNNDGQLALRAALSTRDVSAGIFTDGGAGLKSVALVGDITPGVPTGYRLTSLGYPVINDFGRIAFAAGYRTVGYTGGILYTSDGGSLHMVTRADLPAPGTKGNYFDRFDDPDISNSGHVAFTADLTFPSLHRGLFTDRTGPVEPVALQGMPQGAPYVRTFRDFSDISINSSDRIAFLATLWGDDIQVCTSDINGQYDVVAETGQPIPGAPDILIQQIHFLRLNARGQVAFRAICTKANDPFITYSAILATDPTASSSPSSAPACSSK